VFGAPVAGGEPMLVPLAVPMIAGPSAIATVMLLATREPAHVVEAAIALTLAMVVTTLVLAAAFRLQEILGERGMIALERLMGLVLTALAVEMLLTGVRSFVAQLAH
jgi:small neutral amino acid transporter SnatA (MarC family)